MATKNGTAQSLYDSYLQLSELYASLIIQAKSGTSTPAEQKTLYAASDVIHARMKIAFQRLPH